ncbi:MAG: DUF6285 domain-containing protein [Vulcanimicrobiaceae bacterium]
MSLHDRPTLRELLEAVRDYISDEVAAAAADRRARFRALIAANVVQIALRELDAGPADDAAEHARFAALGLREGTLGARRRTLAQRIRAGDYDDGPARDEVFVYARDSVRRKLAVANPRFVTRVEERPPRPRP